MGGVCVMAFGDGRPEISPPRSFLKVGAYGWWCGLVTSCQVTRFDDDL